MQDDSNRPVRRVLAAFLRLLFPPRCQVCQSLGPESLCARCREAAAPIVPPLCHLCGMPFDPHTHHGLRCPACRAGREFDRARSAYYYFGTIREALLRMKYHDRPCLAEPLGDLVVDVLMAVPAEGSTADPLYAAPPVIPLQEVEAVVPVPLHPRRSRQRGFNQSALLAERVASRLGLPVLSETLRRVRDTPPQVGLSAADRATNVRGAFGPGQIDPARGKNVLLLDDMMTTGATVSECARVLKGDGVSQVYVLTLARQTDVLPRPGGVRDQGSGISSAPSAR